ncbi:nicotinate-nucleotide adenylyltransferase [Planctomicrobium sp. SH668]|uniref:nicotinate-nucleotide adenylyltransferase n=1 Tax=Planctomicrobium sp. SH668 TaxID=3448126 RepID=UPI003F5C8EDF
MKIGVYGGTFDPIHHAHLLLAESAREQCGLDEVWFIPAFQSPFKEAVAAATPKQRIEMLRLAVAGFPVFRVMDLEVKRKEVSYTVETLRQIAQQRPDDQLFLLMGADSLSDFPRWKEPEGILKLATIIAVNRFETPPDLESIRSTLGEQAASSIQVVSMPGINISASSIRIRVSEQRSIRFQTPRAVEQYIEHYRMYRPSAPAQTT